MSEVERSLYALILDSHEGRDLDGDIFIPPPPVRPDYRWVFERRRPATNQKGYIAKPLLSIYLSIDCRLIAIFFRSVYTWNELIDHFFHSSYVSALSWCVYRHVKILRQSTPFWICECNLKKSGWPFQVSIGQASMRRPWPCPFKISQRPNFIHHPRQKSQRVAKETHFFLQNGFKPRSYRPRWNLTVWVKGESNTRNDCW